MSPTLIVGYLFLFTAVGFLFLFANLLIGRLVRPADPHPEKLSVYECGEPTIGSSFVQFDLRFYVIALLFIIFDVEIAFFFPWAAVFGKATHLMDPALEKVQMASVEGETEGQLALTPAALAVYRELGVPRPTLPAPGEGLEENQALIERGADRLAWASILDILVFFGVLMAGFAYVWRRGDLDWVRAVSHERRLPEPRAGPASDERREPALVG